MTFAHVSWRVGVHPRPQLTRGADSFLRRHGYLLSNIPLSRLGKGPRSMYNSLHMNILEKIRRIIKSGMRGSASSAETPRP
jgi:hypothetical protein